MRGEDEVEGVVADDRQVAVAELPDAPRLGKRSPHGLSPRQAAIVVLQGLQRKESAARLHLSVRTIEWYWSEINGRLGISSRAGGTRWCKR